MNNKKKLTAHLGDHTSIEKGEKSMSPDQLERIKRNLNRIIGDRERMLEASCQVLSSGSEVDKTAFKNAAKESQSVLFAVPITINNFKVPGN